MEERSNYMEKKFLFINFYINAGWTSGINHGIAYLAPIPQKHSFQVACLNINHELKEDEFVKSILEFAPTIIAFSSTSHQLKYLFRYSLALRKHSDVLQIAGGVGPTLEPERVLCESAIAGVCIGEGDVPLDRFLELFNREKDIENAEGFYWKTEHGIVKNPIPPFIEDLSQIPFPDYSIYSKEVIDANGDDILVMLSRGCPYSCSYCCNSAFRKMYNSQGYSQKYFRVPSVEYSIRLLEHLVSQNQKKKYIEFEDDLLVADKKWFKKFSQEYRARIHLPYRVCARIEHVDEEMIEMLKRSGCTKIMVGIESGDELFRTKFLNRNYSNRLLFEKCNLIKSSGLELFTFNIIGFPFETDRQMRETLRSNQKIKPDSGQCTFFFPYKGTELYRLCQENDLLLNDKEMLEFTNYNTAPAIKMPSSRRKTCQYLQLKIERYFRERAYLATVWRSVQDILPPAKRNILYLRRISFSYLLFLRNPMLYKIAKFLFVFSGMRKIRNWIG
jgi:anaerobic magnesium-protoporphyrin IX monomethyl ester cyclase